MNRDFSLIDANFARVYEGLRVLEDCARFVLADNGLSSGLKELRHRLPALEAAFGPATVLRGRRGTDAGSRRIASAGLERQSLWSIIRSNSHRVTEALRVLEEFGKLYAPPAVYPLEDIRYRVYTVEYQLAVRTPHYWIRTYFERGVVYPLSSEVDELVWLIEQGARVVQLRDKLSDQATVFEKARKLCVYLKERNVRPDTRHEPALLLINDYPRIAARLPVAGVHIGQDMSVAETRRVVGSLKVIGRSNQTVEQVAVSQHDGADYVSIGPVFATASKAERQPVGLATAAQAAESVEAPLVAIGGITPENIQAVKETGIRNVAVITAARDFFKTSYEPAAAAAPR